MVHDQIITIQLVWFKNKAKFQSWEGRQKILTEKGWWSGGDTRKNEKIVIFLLRFKASPRSTINAS